MGYNKTMLLIIVAVLAFLAVTSIFGSDKSSDFFDSEQTKQIKAAEKTKQIYLQYKIDSTKAYTK